MANRARSGVIVWGTCLLAGNFAPFAGAHAAVVVSSAQTRNISCSGGVCAPTSTDAVLNATDLETMLASGNVEVTTTGSDVQATDIVVSAPFGWSSTSMLALDAYQSITVDRTVSITGQGGLSLTTNDGGNGGSLSFGRKGHAVFQDVSSQLTINGTPYTLVNSIKSLANAVAANPAGAYALANRYDASADGTYSAAPVQTGFTGAFEGLGNAISHLSIKGSGYIGLFQVADGTVENLDLFNVYIIVREHSLAGGLAGVAANVSHVQVTGIIRGEGKSGNDIGGVAGPAGAITYCSANVRIIENQPSAVGGLAGDGNIDESFATGSLTATGTGSVVGGLVAANTGTIQNSYVTGPVTGGARSQVGGLVGENGENREDQGTIQTSYSTGAVSGGNHSKVGGFAGINRSRRGYVQQSYWDTTTSGTDEGTGKGNKSGITGLTTQQLQSGLPSGFDPKVWAENPKVNDGLPYLIANPPSQ
jgi:hypothetical protein